MGKLITKQEVVDNTFIGKLNKALANFSTPYRIEVIDALTYGEEQYVNEYYLYANGNEPFKRCNFFGISFYTKTHNCPDIRMYNSGFRSVDPTHNRIYAKTRFVGDAMRLATFLEKAFDVPSIDVEEV